MDKWLEITISLPVYASILLLIVIIGAIISLGIFLRKLNRRDKALISEIDEINISNKLLTKEVDQLRSQVDGYKNKESIWESDQEAYRHFSYNVSHDISNPLQSVLTNLDNMAQLSSRETGLWRQYHSIIAAEIRRLIKLTESLRQLSRLETGMERINREPVNLKAIIEDVMMARAEDADASGVRLIYDGPERPARIMGDREQLYQVLTNLVDNGIKYSQDQGGEVVINILEESESICIRIIDNGIGIPEEDLPYIFETAYRSPETRKHKRQGSGYGLAIVKRIVEQHGGNLEVQSRQHEGTTFYFDLPLYTPSDK
jgi:two-component system sensor histidine kinase VicK